MGSSGSESVDCGVGSIVWVRRRNGSWWPGKILGPNDLSSNHLMSPRSGTPVKLLGREDASVDWYNLEKSKRVKAFRCGDFDECIERAESSVGMPPKKREKYARREDAILHALELEKQMLDNQGRRLDIASDINCNKSSNSGEKGSITSSGNQEPDDLNGHNPLEHLSEGIVASSIHENGCHLLNKTKEATMQEDAAPPKMRGLQEFGLLTVPSKRKFSSSFKSDEVDRPNSRYRDHTTSAGGYILRRDNHINFINDRKPSPESSFLETSATGYYRCSPAIQVSQNSANLPLLREIQPESHVSSLYVSAPDHIKNAYPAKSNRCLYLPAESYDCLGNISEWPQTQKQVSHFPVRESNYPLHVSASDDNTSDFSEDTESDSSASNSETDSDEEMNAPAGQGAGLLDSIDRSQAERRHGNTSNKEIDDSSQADELPLSADDEVSKWKLKGKRNVRRVSKRSSDVTDNGDEMNEETYLEMQGNTFDHRISRLRVNYRQSNDFNSYLGGDDSFDRDYWIPGSALGNKRYSTLRHMPRGRSNNSNDHFVDWDDMSLERRTPLNGYLVKTRDYYSSDYHGQAYVGHDRLGGRRRNMLFEVDLKVQSSYPKQRVPIISLMSKIDGRAITGHSLQIEELQEGSSDTLFSKRSEFGYGRFLGEIDYALPSVWRTARRTTNYRVPLSPAVDSGGDVDYLPLGRKPASMDLNASLGNLMEKIDPCALRPPATKKPTKKYSKKVSMSSSQKTRTLSSFCVDQHEQIGHGRHDDVEAFCLSELIKSESGTSTATCCIPVKLVFRRLYEAVGRPPEAIPPPPIHEALPNKNNQIQQSCT